MGCTRSGGAERSGRELLQPGPVARPVLRVEVLMGLPTRSFASAALGGALVVLLRVCRSRGVSLPALGPQRELEVGSELLVEILVNLVHDRKRLPLETLHDPLGGHVLLAAGRGLFPGRD